MIGINIVWVVYAIIADLSDFENRRSVGLLWIKILFIVSERINSVVLYEREGTL